MTSDRHSLAKQRDLIEDPDERAKQEALNGFRQYDLLIEMIRARIVAGSDKYALKQSDILRLQEAALQDIHPLAGTYRNSDIEIIGSKHAPPAHFEVPEEMGSMCQYVNNNWDGKTGLHLAAYLLWKLNWIHPFADGNGRTARAVSYLVLSIKLGSVLPGTPTIPEQISVDKGPYYDALEKADRALDQIGTVDVSALEDMLADMLKNQLLSRPTMPDFTKKYIQEIFSNRVIKSDDHKRALLYGSPIVTYQIWSVGEYLVLQVSGESDVIEADERQTNMGNPFPRLLYDDDVCGVWTKVETQGGELVRFDGVDVTQRFGLSVAPDCAAIVPQPSVRWGEHDGNSWSSSGALYIVRLGDEVTLANVGNTFDFLIARHQQLSEVRANPS